MTSLTQHPAKAVTKSYRQREDRERGVHVSAGRKYGVPGDMQIRYAMNSRVRVYDTVPRIFMHTRGAHMMMQAGSLEYWSIVLRQDPILTDVGATKT